MVELLITQSKNNKQLENRFDSDFKTLNIMRPGEFKRPSDEDDIFCYARMIASIFFIPEKMIPIGDQIGHIELMI